MEKIVPTGKYKKQLEDFLKQLEETDEDIYFEGDEYPTDKEYLKMLVLNELYGDHIYFSEEEVKNAIYQQIKDSKNKKLKNKI